uniref:Uncharacterized protein n=1 Tax=Arundo donax TaxID=35708 RepID=A0A0A9ATU9_ARUDO
MWMRCSPAACASMSTASPPQQGPTQARPISTMLPRSAATRRT